MFFQSHKSLWASTISSGTRSRFLGRIATSACPPTLHFRSVHQPLFYCKFRQQETSLCARKLCGSNFSGVNQISTSSHRIPLASYSRHHTVLAVSVVLMMAFNWINCFDKMFEREYYRIVFTWPNFDECDKKIFFEWSICFLTAEIRKTIFYPT